MGEMSESVPLCPRLGVHCVQIIICIALCESLDLMLEGFATKRRLVWHVQWQTDKTSAPFPITLFQCNVLYWHDLPGSDFFSGSSHTCGREKIQTANLDESLEHSFFYQIYLRSHHSPKPKLPLPVLREYQATLFL
jgi:hypothetical protein